MTDPPPPYHDSPQRVLVGRGYCADVYAWGDGRVLKLFHPRYGRAKAERELAVTRAVHAAGLPAPAAFDVAEADGRWGVVLERIDGPSMVDAVKARPWTLFAAARQLAELHADLHGRAVAVELPSQREELAAGIEASDRTAAEKAAARRALAELPDGDAVCHGDFHPGNVLLAPRGPVVIDWSAATRGHPLGDVALTRRLFELAEMPAWEPRSVRLLLAVSRSLLHRTYLNHYGRLRGTTRRDADAWHHVVAVADDRWRSLESPD
jgi:uncharacterized protein (TIGR02172 family)